MSHNIDLLCGACLANGVSIEGHSYDEMRATLGSVLVDKMLGCPPTSPVKRDDQGGAKKRRAPSLWHQFCKAEKANVRRGMPHLKGHEVLREISRRWRLQKVVNTDSLSCSPTQARRRTARTEQSKASRRS